VPDKSVDPHISVHHKKTSKFELLAALEQKPEPRPSTLGNGHIFELFLRRQQKTYDTGIFEAKWPYV
jgi:hypothetical protein